MGSAYNRIVLKISGEALAGENRTGLNEEVLSRIAKEVKEVRDIRDAKETKEIKEIKETKEAAQAAQEAKSVKGVREFKKPAAKKQTRELRPVKQEKREPQKPKRHEKTEEEERPNDLVETNEHPALTFITELAEKMELTLDIKAMKNDDSIYIDIEGKDSGTIIGKRGQTLDSIQYLASLVANKEKEKYVKVVVDAENYRNKREKTLEQLADKLAGKVTRTKKTIRLEPMNPYERKIIHARLQGNAKVFTRSEGEEPYRRVVIELK